MIRVSVCDDSEWFDELAAASIEPYDDLGVVGSADERASARPADAYPARGGGEQELVAGWREVAR